MVLQPLGMSASSFPHRRRATGVITGHRLTDEGIFEPEPTRMCIVPAAAGLWTTAADLVRFGLGWSSLLPDAFARQALAPQVQREGAPGGQMGLGWILNLSKDLAGHHGGGPGSYASLNVRPSTGQTWVVLTNRLVSVEPVNDRLIRPIA